MQIKRCIQKADRLHLVTFETPLKLSFEEGVLRTLALCFTNLEKELKLLGRVIILLLFNTTIDHTIQWLQVGFILLGGSLICLVRLFIFAFKAPLVASFCLVACIFRLQYDCHVQELQRLGENLTLTAAKTGEKARNIENEV